MTALAWGSSAMSKDLHACVVSEFRLPPWRSRRHHRPPRLLPHRALEKVGVYLAPEARGVGEHEIAEVVLGDEPVLHELVRLGPDVGHVGTVEVADGGAEQG